MAESNFGTTQFNSVKYKSLYNSPKVISVQWPGSSKCEEDDGDFGLDDKSHQMTSECGRCCFNHDTTQESSRHASRDYPCTCKAEMKMLTSEDEKTYSSGNFCSGGGGHLPGTQC